MIFELPIVTMIVKTVIQHIFCLFKLSRSEHISVKNPCYDVQIKLTTHLGLLKMFLNELFTPTTSFAAKSKIVVQPQV